MNYIYINKIKLKGLYNVDITTKVGKGRNSPFVPSVSAKDNKKYDFRLIPSIKKINSNIGSPQGQILEIIGTGFTLNKSVISVKYGNVDCVVLKSSDKSITCDLKPSAKNTDTFHVGGSGHEAIRFEEKVKSNILKAESLFNLINTTTINNSNLPTKINHFIRFEYDQEIE